MTTDVIAYRIADIKREEGGGYVLILVCSCGQQPRRDCTYGMAPAEIQSHKIYNGPEVKRITRLSEWIGKLYSSGYGRKTRKKAIVALIPLSLLFALGIWLIHAHDSMALFVISIIGLGFDILYIVVLKRIIHDALADEELRRKLKADHIPKLPGNTRGSPVKIDANGKWTIVQPECTHENVVELRVLHRREEHHVIECRCLSCRKVVTKIVDTTYPVD